MKAMQAANKNPRCRGIAAETKKRDFKAGAKILRFAHRLWFIDGIPSDMECSKSLVAHVEFLMSEEAANAQRLLKLEHPGFFFDYELRKQIADEELMTASAAAELRKSASMGAP